MKAMVKHLWLPILAVGLLAGCGTGDSGARPPAPEERNLTVEQQIERIPGNVPPEMRAGIEANIREKAAQGAAEDAARKRAAGGS